MKWGKRCCELVNVFIADQKKKVALFSNVIVTQTELTK